MKTGKLVIIEGIDGSGKDTQADLLVKNNGYIKTRLPIYDTDIGGIIKHHIDNGKKRVTEEYFQTLMLANYIEHLNLFILPQIKKGNDVVMTRFTQSMEAYGYTFDANEDFIDSLVEAAEEIYESKIGQENIVSFYLDIPIDVGLERINQRDQKIVPVFENKEVLEKVHRHYDDMKRWNFNKVIDGTKGIQTIHSKITNFLT